MSKPIITSFNTIAPILIQQYERYLPSAFDESMSILQKMNKIIEYLNQIGELTNDVVEQWNVVMEWVLNDGLNTSLESVLDEWNESGKLSDIINERVFSDLYNDLNGKITTLGLDTTDSFDNVDANFRKNSTLINMADLAQDVKTGMTGGSVAVVGVNSVSAINTNKNSLTVDEMKFINKTKNLFIYGSLTKNKAISTAGGSVIESTGNGYSDYIRVSPADVLYKNTIGGVHFYDASKVWISGLAGDTIAQSITVPANTYYIRVNMKIIEEETYQLEYGGVGTSYQKGTLILDKKVQTTDENISNINGGKINPLSVSLNALSSSKKSKNVLNTNNVLAGYVNRIDGKIVVETSNKSFYMIPIEDTQFRIKPFSKGVANIAFYDINKVVIVGSGLQILTTNTNWVIDVPASAKFFSVSFNISEYTTAMISFGSEDFAYEKYYNYPLDLVFPTSLNEDSTGELQLSVTQSSSEIKINVPQDSQTMIEYVLKKEVIPFTTGSTYQNYDGWRITGCSKVVYNNGVESSRLQITNTGAWECAIEIVGYADFVGTYHGYERMKNFYPYVDNVKSVDGVHNAKNVRLIYTATLYEQGTENVAIADVERVYEFSKDGLFLHQKYVWKKAYAEVDDGYLTMLPILRDNVSHTAIADYNYTEYDVSDETIYRDINAPHSDVKWANVYGDEVGASITVEYENERANQFNVSNATAYNKMYFSYNTGQPIVIGDVWKSKTHFDIRG